MSSRTKACTSFHEAPFRDLGPDQLGQRQIIDPNTPL
jgi:hypothetical protein